MTANSDIAIRIRGLGKAYRIVHGQEKHTTLGEAIAHRIRHPFQRLERETFWALKDVDLDIKKGDVVGIIGRNGAGKSTLLKILSRITEPTTGEVDLYGRVGSLLEVGTGFHPELTGRENIFLNGAILGMKRREILRQFDAIVEFAGVEKFLDTPVKRYSSGMYVRLAFAVAAHLNPEILLVDEVLAVGDAEFQKKCLGKMKEVSTQQGRTVLFVSHNMQSVALLCTSGAFLASGRVTYFGDAAGAVERYTKSFAASGNTQRAPTQRPGTGEYRFTSAWPEKQVFEGAEPIVVRFRVERFRAPLGRMHVSAHIVNEMGAIIVQCDSRLKGFWLDDSEKSEGFLTIRGPWLRPGEYRVDLFICAPGLIDVFEDACRFTVSPVLPYPYSCSPDGYDRGCVFGDYDWHSGEPVEPGRPEHVPPDAATVK